MNAFDISGPSKLGKELQKSAKHRVHCTKVADDMRTKKAGDSKTVFSVGKSKISKRDYKEMRMKK